MTEWRRCAEHPDVDGATMWGCPDCLAELRRERDQVVGERDRLAGRLEQAQNDLLAESAKGDEVRLLDAENAGATLTAEALLAIARTGEHAGTFGGEEIEACAQAILTMRRALEFIASCTAHSKVASEALSKVGAPAGATEGERPYRKTPGGGEVSTAVEGDF